MTTEAAKTFNRPFLATTNIVASNDINEESLHYLADQVCCLSRLLCVLLLCFSLDGLCCPKVVCCVWHFPFSARAFEEHGRVGGTTSFLFCSRTDASAFGGVLYGRS